STTRWCPARRVCGERSARPVRSYRVVATLVGEPSARVVPNSERNSGELRAARRLQLPVRQGSDSFCPGGIDMARRTRRRRYSPSASRDVASALRRRKRGTLRSGKGGKGGRVKSRKQAIAIALSEARKKGKKVPRKRS